MRTLELPYVAGIVDGEGHIGFQDKRKLNLVYLRLSIANTNLQVLTALQEQFGGSVKTAKPPKGHHKQVYHWALYAQKAAHFIEHIYPWLIIKHKQAKLALKFYEIGAPSRSESTRNFQSVMGQLNKRGA